jgi:hypothetical protein
MITSNKKAMELSINFIVMLIIALVVFGMGLILFKKVFVGAGEIKEDLDQQTIKELTAKMMATSDQVVVYPASLTVRRGKSGVVGIGILNTDSSQGSFKTTVAYQNICYDTSGQTRSASECQGAISSAYTSPNFKEQIIAANKREIVQLPIRVSSSASSGKYVVEVTVEQGTSFRFNTLVYITVP